MMENLRSMFLVPLVVAAFYSAAPVHLVKTGSDLHAKLEIIHRSDLKNEEYPKLIDELMYELKGSISSGSSGSKDRMKDELELLQQLTRLDSRLCNREDLDKLAQLARAHGKRFKEYVFSQRQKLLAECPANALELPRDKSDARDDTNESDKSTQHLDQLDLLHYGGLNSEQNSNLIDEVVESSDSKLTDMQRSELELLQRMKRLDLKLCDKENLDPISDLGRSYGGQFNKYVTAQMKKLIAACITSASDALSKKLDDKENSNGLNKMIKFVESCKIDPAGHGEYIKNLAQPIYRDELITRIIDYMNMMSKSDNWALRKHSIIREKKNKEDFDRQYGKYVLRMCRDWISATDELSTKANWYKDLKGGALTGQQTGWLNNRLLCKKITSEESLKPLRESVYKKLRKNQIAKCLRLPCFGNTANKEEE